MEEILREMLGHSIVAVTYHEIDYGDALPMWNRESPSFDSLDFGLTLRLDDDSVFHVAWGHEYAEYNISVARGLREYGDRTWDATSRWSARLKQPIVEARLVWRPAELEESSPQCPLSVVLRFQDGGAVVISAFEFRRDDNFKFAMTDHVTVFFDEAEARRFDLL